MMLAANKESSFGKVKLKDVCRFACPVFSISEVNFMVIPVAMLLAIQLTIPDKNMDVKVAIRFANSCDVERNDAAGMTMTDLTTIVTNPVKIPATKKGIKYCTKFREYKLKVCVKISPMESSCWRFWFSTNYSSGCQ